MSLTRLAQRLRARRRALVLLAIVLDLPFLGRLVRLLTGTPVVEERRVDGVSVELVRPAGLGPWPTWIFVNGAHPLRRREPVVWRLAQGLARAGYLVVVPDIPGLGEGTITARTLAATETVVRFAADEPDVRGGRVALIGASTGAGLALLAAGRVAIAERVSVVAAVAPYANLRKLICLTTTSRYEEGGEFAEYEVTELHRQVVARSLVAALPDEGERARLLDELGRIEVAGLDPLEELPKRAGAVGPDARAVLDLLENRDPARFDDLYEALPGEALAFVEELTPVSVAGGLRAPIEVVVPPSDVYFPLAEAESLASELPNVRLTVTSALDHTRPSASLARLKDFAAFDGFVVRGLTAAG